MNECKIYVDNIISDVADSDGKWHTLMCDTDSYGSCKYGVKVYLCPTQYRDVIEKGYYMG